MNVVIYTCTFLDYDQIFSPLRVTPGARYVIFSDRRPRFVKHWQWRPLPEKVRGLSQAMANRYCKFFAHELFPEAEISLYVDGNVLLLDDLTPLINEFAASRAEIGLFAHRQRGDVFAEFEFSRRAGKVSPGDIALGARQLDRYRAAGLPQNHTFTENGVIFRRHGGPGLDRAMRLWWKEINTYIRRDQLSLPYVLHTTGIDAKVWTWNFKFENPYFVVYPHRGSLAVNAGIFLRNKSLGGGYRGAFFKTLLYALRYATGNFKPLEPWRKIPE